MAGRRGGRWWRNGGRRRRWAVGVVVGGVVVVGVCGGTAVVAGGAAAGGATSGFDGTLGGTAGSVEVVGGGVLVGAAVSGAAGVVAGLSEGDCAGFSVARSAVGPDGAAGGGGRPARRFAATQAGEPYVHACLVAPRRNEVGLDPERQHHRVALGGEAPAAQRGQERHRIGRIALGDLGLRHLAVGGEGHLGGDRCALRLSGRVLDGCALPKLRDAGGPGDLRHLHREGDGHGELHAHRLAPHLGHLVLPLAHGPERGLVEARNAADDLRRGHLALGIDEHFQDDDAPDALGHRLLGIDGVHGLDALGGGHAVLASGDHAGLRERGGAAHQPDTNDAEERAENRFHGRVRPPKGF